MPSRLVSSSPLLYCLRLSPHASFPLPSLLRFSTRPAIGHRTRLITPRPSKTEGIDLLPHELRGTARNHNVLILASERKMKTTRRELREIKRPRGRHSTRALSTTGSCIMQLNLNTSRNPGSFNTGLGKLEGDKSTAPSRARTPIQGAHETTTPTARRHPM